jgi:cyclase
MNPIRNAVAGALLLVAAAQAQDLSQARLDTVPVRDDIWMLAGPGGNIGVAAGPDGVVLVDNQFAPMTDRILAAVAGISPAPVRLVINTHWHGDHTGGNENLAGAGAVIIAHGNVRRRMSGEQVSAFFASRVPPAPPAALPVLTFEHSVTLHLNGQTMHVLHLPAAHTDGDAVVRFEQANVIHLGDLYFNGFYPFIDVEAGGSLDGMVRALDAVLEQIGPETRVIPGHGPLSDRAGVLRYRGMLASVEARLRALHAEELDIDQIVAAGPTREFDAEWGGGFIKPDQWVRLMHRSLRL